MSLNANNVEMKGGSRPDPVEEGNYPARLVQIIDLGVQEQRPYQGQAKEPIQTIQVAYELANEFMLDEDGNEDKERPRWIFEDFPFHNLKADRAKSTKRYKALDPSGDHDGDWSALIGAPCTVTVVCNPSKKDPSVVYNNVGNVTPPMKGFPVPELVNDPIVFSYDEPDAEVLSAMSDYMKNKLKASLDYPGSAVQAILEGQAQEPTAEEAVEEGEESPF
jgi:hypothetical protein